MNKPWLVKDRRDGIVVRRVRAEPDALDRAAYWLRRTLTPATRRSFPRLSPMVWRVQRALADIENASDADILERADRLRAVIVREGLRARHVAAAFALGMIATQRELGFRHHPVQILGGLHILRGRLVEMATGEGKTITAVLPAIAAALAGNRVHVLTTNEYLAARDCAALAPIFARVGLSTALARQDADPMEKRNAHAADIVYLTSSALVFDHLRDKIALSGEDSRTKQIVDRFAGGGRLGVEPLVNGLLFAIVDEVDSLLIDEARTPLIISGTVPGGGFAGACREALALAGQLSPGADFMIDAATRSVSLTEQGRARVHAAQGISEGHLRALKAREEFVRSALSALHLFHRGQHYVVAEGEVQIVDESTGRIMPDRKWEHGLHQMIELKEGCEMSDRRSTLAQMTFQRFFRQYLWFGGMSGTLRPVARELAAAYDSAIVRIPTNRRVLRRFTGLQLFRKEADKWAQVAERARTLLAQGRPVLIGTRSVEASQALSAVLAAKGLAHQLLNALHDAEEAAIIAQAGQGPSLTVSTNMAGRGTDIVLSDAARKAGGLHVILTEFHESKRIDRQLFGRAGRQGDPGSCEAIVSLEDNLFRQFCRPGLLGSAHIFLHVFPWTGGLLGHYLGWQAQLRAERLAAKARMATIKADAATEKQLHFARRN